MKPSTRTPRLFRSTAILLLCLFSDATLFGGEPQSKEWQKPSSARVTGIGAPQRQVSTRPAEKFRPGELLVRFRRGVAKLRTDALHARIRAVVMKQFRAVDNLQLVRLPAGARMEEAIRAYRQNPEVLYAEPNYIRTIDQSPVTPNDPRFAELWGLHNTGQSGGTPGADIHAPEAWGLSTGSSNVVVGVIDTGIDYNHEDLNANMFRNPLDCNSNGIDDDGNGYADDCYGIDTFNSDSDPMDDHGHGTHVAGTIGAAGNNGVGVVGVNWQVKIIACKFLDSSGSGSDSGAIACLDYLADLRDRGVNIAATNNSWGGGNFSQALLDAIDSHRQRGILFVAAAGNVRNNNDVSPSYPDGYFLPNVIAVAATDRSDARDNFSNFGRHTVHLGAPGVAILSTLPGNSYGTMSGTSMASPHVTGVAALLKAQDPTRDWKTIKNLILAGGDTISALDSTISQKRLNAKGAMTCSNSTLLTRLRPIPSTLYVWPGQSATVDLAALHINCASPNGNLQVSIDGGAETLTLLDDGKGTDQEAGDGIYSAQKVWQSSDVGTHTMSFPGNDVVTVLILPQMMPYLFNSSVPFNYRTIAGTNLNLGDDSSAEVAPPFPILFGGASFPTLNVNANGNVTFFQPFSNYRNEALPTSSTPMLVAPFWADLYPSGSNNVWWEVTGAAPNRELVIEWRDVSGWGCSGSEAGMFQVVFLEGSSDILFNYADVTFGGGCAFADQGASATVGVQSMPNLATQFSFNTPSLADYTAILWQLGYPVPAISRLSPFTALAGGSGLTLDVFGSNFFPQSVVQWNGNPLSTTFVSARQLSAAITAAEISAAGTAQVSVVNPLPGGGPSNLSPFTIYDTYPTPSLTSLSPSTVIAPANDFVLTLTGTDFVSASVVRWNRADRPTTMLGSTQAQAKIQYGDVADGGAVQVTVFTPAPGGGVSSPLAFTVENPAPMIGSIFPAAVAPGADFTLIVMSGYRDCADPGNDPCYPTFVPASVVRWNGADRATLFFSEDQLEASIPANDIPAAGTADITVFNPAPGGGTSNVVQIAIVPRPPNDDFANALVVSTLPFTHTEDTRTATVEPADLPFMGHAVLGGCLNIINVVTGLPILDARATYTVWYRFTPSTTATVRANMLGTNYGYVPNVYLATLTEAPGPLTLLRCTQSRWNPPFNEHVFTANAGQTYYFLIGQYFNDPLYTGGGNLVFNLVDEGPPFSISPASGSPTSATVNAGQTATYSLSFAGTSGFNGAVSLSCSGAPSAAFCSVSPSTLILNGTTPVAATVTVTTTARAALPPLGGPPNAPLRFIPLLLPCLLALAALLFYGWGYRTRRFAVRTRAVVLTTVFVLLLLSSCGGGGSVIDPHVGTQPGTYTITVTATSGSASRSLPLTLTVR